MDKQKEAATAGTSDGTVLRESPDKSAYALFDKCKFMQYCCDNGATMPEPYWFAMASNLVRCQNGEIIARELSNKNIEQTDRMILHALSSMNPATCIFIINILNFDACSSGECGVKAPYCLAISEGT